MRIYFVLLISLIGFFSLSLRPIKKRNLVKKYEVIWEEIVHDSTAKKRDNFSLNTTGFIDLNLNTYYNGVLKIIIGNKVIFDSLIIRDGNEFFFNIFTNKKIRSNSDLIVVTNQGKRLFKTKLKTDYKICEVYNVDSNNWFIRYSNYYSYFEAQ